EIQFFFSSRRRHTRWPRDWSSDVCSSDLVAMNLLAGRPCHFILLSMRGRVLFDDFAHHENGSASLQTYCPQIERRSPARAWGTRSEERRVGKECRSRWSQCRGE